MVLNPTLDRSVPVPDGVDSSSRSYRDFLNKMGLVDIWRELHSLTKDYTYYSTLMHVTLLLTMRMFLETLFLESVLLLS